MKLDEIHTDEPMLVALIRRQLEQGRNILVDVKLTHRNSSGVASFDNERYHEVGVMAHPWMCVMEGANVKLTLFTNEEGDHIDFLLRGNVFDERFELVPVDETDDVDTMLTYFFKLVNRRGV